MQIEKRLNIISTIVFIVVILSLILLFSNWMTYNKEDIIQSYEDQIRIVQDKSLIENIANASFEEFTNEVSGEPRISISTGSAYTIKCIYTDSGEIVDLEITTYTVLAVFMAILLGGLLGSLISFVICLAIENIMKERAKCKK